MKGVIGMKNGLVKRVGFILPIVLVGSLVACSETRLKDTVIETTRVVGHALPSAEASPDFESNNYYNPDDFIIGLDDVRYGGYVSRSKGDFYSVVVFYVKGRPDNFSVRPYSDEDRITYVKLAGRTLGLYAKNDSNDINLFGVAVVKEGK